MKQCSWSLPTFRVTFKVAFLTPVFTFLEFCPYSPSVVLLYLTSAMAPWSLFKTFLKYVWGVIFLFSHAIKNLIYVLMNHHNVLFWLWHMPCLYKVRAPLQQWTFYHVILIAVFISVHSYICGFTCKASRPEMGHLHKSSHYHPYSPSFYDVFKKRLLRLFLCMILAYCRRPGLNSPTVSYYPVSWSFELKLHRETSCFVAGFVLCLA